MLSTGVLMLIGMTVILGTFLIVFVIPFYREYYQVTKKNNASKKRLMRATKALIQIQTRSCTKQSET